MPFVRKWFYELVLGMVVLAGGSCAVAAWTTAYAMLQFAHAMSTTHGVGR